LSEIILPHTLTLLRKRTGYKFRAWIALAMKLVISTNHHITRVRNRRVWMRDTSAHGMRGASVNGAAVSFSFRCGESVISRVEVDSLLQFCQICMAWFGPQGGRTLACCPRIPPDGTFP
jgi:hypothetical protein